MHKGGGSELGTNMASALPLSLMKAMLSEDCVVRDPEYIHYSPHPNPNCFPNHINFFSQTQDNPDGVPNPHISASPPQQQLTPFISTSSYELIDLRRTIKQNFNNILLQHPAFHNHKIISAHWKNRSLDSILHTSKFPDQTQPTLQKTENWSKTHPAAQLFPH